VARRVAYSPEDGTIVDELAAPAWPTSARVAVREQGVVAALPTFLAGVEAVPRWRRWIVPSATVPL